MPMEIWNGRTSDSYCSAMFLVDANLVRLCPPRSTSPAAPAVPRHPGGIAGPAPPRAGRLLVVSVPGSSESNSRLGSGGGASFHRPIHRAVTSAFHLV